MNNFTTELHESLLINNFNLEVALKTMLRDNIEFAINELLKNELTAVLQYERYERSDSTNYRNGYYSRDFNTSYGVLHLNIPRDRNNEFASPLVPKYERKDSTTEETVLKLFNTGLTNSEISNIISSLYAKKYSKTTISNITDNIIVKIDEFKTRSLESTYAVVYLDATFIALRRDTVKKEAVYIALGVRTNGNKEIIGYKIAPTESCELWTELLTELKERGIQKVGLFCTDGLQGMPEAINKLFPNSKIQRCLVHVSRNIFQKARVKDRAEIAADFKEVYNAPDKKAAETNLVFFKDKWKVKYPRIKDTLDNNEYLLTFYDFPEEIRSSIYSTNMIESFNKQLKRKTKRKEQFPNEESLDKFLVVLFEEYNSKFLNRVHKGFGSVPVDTWSK